MKTQLKSIYRHLDRHNEINQSDYPVIKKLLQDHLTSCSCGNKLFKKADAIVTFHDDGTHSSVDCLDNIWYECESCYSMYDLSFNRLKD